MAWRLSSALLSMCTLLSIYTARAEDLSDPTVPLPAAAVRIARDWKVGFHAWKLEERPLAGSIVDLRGALDDLINSTQGLSLFEEDFSFLVRMDSDLLFDFDSYDLREEAKTTHKSFAQLIATHKSRELTVTGHTDSKGDDAYNERLSLRRAQSVATFLLAEGKLTSWALTPFGRGEREPISRNQTPAGLDDPEGRQKNRRVEIRIQKVKG